MKKIAIIVAMMFVISMVAVVADEEENPGITPDSMFYGLEKVWDNVRLGLTFNKEKKATKALDIAQEKMIEAKAMAEKGNDVAAEIAKEQYDLNLQKAQDVLEKIKSDETEKDNKKVLEELVRVQNKIEEHYEKVSEVKDRILEKMRTRNMSEEKIAKIEGVFQKIQNKAKETENKIVSKKDNIKIKYKAASEKTEKEVESDIKNIEDAQGLTKARKERKNKIENRTKINIEKLKAKVKEQKDQGLDVGDVEARIQALEMELQKDIVRERVREIDDIIQNKTNQISIVARQLKEAKKEGNFDEVKEQLKEAIQERQKEMDKVKNDLDDKKDKLQDVQDTENQLKKKTQKELKNKMDELLDEVDSVKVEANGTTVNVSESKVEVENNNSKNSAIIDNEKITIVTEDKGKNNTNDVIILD